MQVGSSGIRLILAGREGSHVVERSCFPRSQLRWNGRWTLCLHNPTSLPKTASMYQLSGNLVVSGN